MKITYKYLKSEDVWCLINKGKSSYNSPKPTKIYQQLVVTTGEDPGESLVSDFIDSYIKTHNYNIGEKIKLYQNEFDSISDEFQRIAEGIFNVSLPSDITVYLTINNRCPYRISENLFFVCLLNESVIRTSMHELWHFYTWYKFGKDESERIGPEKYNEIKESLTVLLNVTCKHLLPEGVEDNGYPQHHELRTEILRLWEQNPNIDSLWNKLTNQS